MFNATAMRSHFSPDNIEGIKLGDLVVFHVTNLEQDWDVPHGFTVKGIDKSQLLIMPGQTHAPLPGFPRKQESTHFIVQISVQRCIRKCRDIFGFHLLILMLS